VTRENVGYREMGGWRDGWLERYVAREMGSYSEMVA
jgi:hypothetical protein